MRVVGVAGLIASSGCISVGVREELSLGGKLKTAPVSDVAPVTIPAAYENPDELPPKEPAINVLAKRETEEGS